MSLPDDTRPKTPKSRPVPQALRYARQVLQHLRWLPLSLNRLPIRAFCSVAVCLCSALTVGHAETDFSAWSLLDEPQLEQLLATQPKPTQVLPPILLIIVDTLRADRVHSGLMPTLAQFIKDNVSAHKTLAAATSTDHSLFSTFFMRPAWERELYYQKGWQAGSPAVRLLQRAGYSINLFAYPSWYSCTRNPTHSKAYKASPWSNWAQLEMLYGVEGRLLSRCPNHTDAPVFAEDFFVADQQLIAQYLATIAHDLASPAPVGRADGPPRFDILHLYGLHDPYGVDPAHPSLKYPWRDGQPGRERLFARQRIVLPVVQNALRNTYDNAALSLDSQLRTLFTDLRRTGRYDSTFIVVMSDHGESLPDGLQLLFGHGFTPSMDQCEVIMAFKPVQSNWPVSPVAWASTSALFPTIFDLLDLDIVLPKGNSETLRSASMLHAAASCFFTTTPNQSWPPEQIVIADGYHKLFATVAGRDATLYPTHIVANEITDMSDQPVENPDHRRAVQIQLQQCLLCGRSQFLTLDGRACGCACARDTAGLSHAMWNATP